MNKKKKVIWFIDGPVPSVKDHEIVDRMSSHRVQVVFRNAQQVGPKESLEECDAVGGCVPSAYSAKPRVDQDHPANAKLEEQVRREESGQQESPPPPAPAKLPPPPAPRAK